MSKPHRQRRRRVGLIVASLALVAAACGGSGGSARATEESSAAIAAAATNVGRLQLTDDLVATHLLDTRDGSITSLSEVVTGDRPVLLWYWAPH